jgi:CMP-2-keto-3-deoxyoctulosonic acid synthetase
MEKIRMYAVIFERKPIYLGTEPGKAIDVFNSTAGSELHKIESLEQLSGLV